MTLVLLEQVEGVATLTLNRPGMGNALVPELLDALLSQLAQVRDDDGVRAVVLRANGPVFSLGGDMRRFHRAYFGDIVGYAAELVGGLNRAILGLIDLPQPVVRPRRRCSGASPAPWPRPTCWRSRWRMRRARSPAIRRAP
jgi:2-(1,2-epoxy-1,2-dihydrophenyl)acetyl-CoA isomerase